MAKATHDLHHPSREYLSITLSFNHDLIDEAPAARFTGRLKELIESGYGLAESEAGRPVEQSVKEEP